MQIDTDNLASLCRDYQTITNELGYTELDPDTELQLITPISDEMSHKFGSFVYYASSIVLVGGLESHDDMHGVAITDPSSFFGVNPRVESIVYPHSRLGHLGLTPSLLFDTHEPAYNSGASQGVSQLFPHVALPLLEPHYVEAIALYE